MSPMKDLQARAAKVGRIRTGISVVKNGKQRPEKLTRFLLTTESRHVADAIADVYGGKVDPYLPMGGAQRGWQVLVGIDEIPVAVPPGQQVVSQWWEMWSGGGLSRRCDGVTASVWGGGNGEQRVPCKCPADLMDRAASASQKTPAACRPSTRVSLILPDVPGTGTFMVESHGLYAAQELGGVAELMGKASAAGVMLPALLRLEQRDGVRRPGEVTNRFAVPVLQLQHSIRELMAMAEQGPSASQLPPAPARAITAGTPTTPAGTPPRPAGADGAAPAPHPPEVAGADTAREDLQPDGQAGAGAPMSAQQIADRARAARSKPVVDALSRTAAELGLLDDMVEDGTGVLVALSDVLHTRLDDMVATA